MRATRFRSRLMVMAGAAVVAVVSTAAFVPSPANAGFPWGSWWKHRHQQSPCASCAPMGIGEGAWYWMRSPEQEKQVIISHYTRYCVRCHGIDGRGVWDIPGVPNFADARWQSCRPDDSLVRSIIEGRGAVMPPFRGTLTLEEAWAMARYLRTFVPGTETPRMDRAPESAPTSPSEPTRAAATVNPPGATTPAPPPPIPPSNSRGAFAR
jgi:mono/diheme cytochrome c family protein